VSTWKRKALELFPNHRDGRSSFQQPKMSIYQIYFKLKSDLDTYLQEKDQDAIGRIFSFVNWCFEQREQAPDIWNATATAFLEHLADTDERAELIPYWVKPEIFTAMRDEFYKRREKEGNGKFAILVEQFNRVNGTELE
jgi:L-fucose isomerase-like protein